MFSLRSNVVIVVIYLAISEILSNQRLVSVGSHLERAIRDKLHKWILWIFLQKRVAIERFTEVLTHTQLPVTWAPGEVTVRCHIVSQIHSAYPRDHDQVWCSV